MGTNFNHGLPIIDLLPANLPGSSIVPWLSEVGPQWMLGIQTENALDIPVRIGVTWNPGHSQGTSAPRAKSGVCDLQPHDFQLFFCTFYLAGL